MDPRKLNSKKDLLQELTEGDNELEDSLELRDNKKNESPESETFKDSEKLFEEPRKNDQNVENTDENKENTDESTDMFTFGIPRSTQTYFIKREEKSVTGLEKLNHPALPPIGDNERFFPGAILGNRMYVGDKPGGMEPGALLIEINIDLVKTLQDKKVIDATDFLKSPHRTKEECIEFIKKEMDKIHQQIDPSYLVEPTRKDESGKELELKLVKFRKQLSKTPSSIPTSPTFLQEKKLIKTDSVSSDDSLYDDSESDFVLVDQDTIADEKMMKDEVSQQIENLDQAIKDIRKNAKQGLIPLSLIKQYYNDTSFAGPTPPFYRMKNTNRGKNSSTALVKIWKITKALKTSSSAENQNAISEVFATGVARAFQMPAQNQFILIGAYKNGKLMITTDADWETKFRPIEKNFAGQSENHPYSQTCYVDKSISSSKISYPRYQSQLDSLKCAAQNLMLMILQCDDDGFGSQLQNKGMITQGNVTELYAIDLGHAYREKNDLVNYLSLDFTLGTKKLEKYKNLSILFDSPPTDKMLGLFYTYKTLSTKSKKDIGITKDDEKEIEKAIALYKEYYKENYPAFSNKIDNIQSGCIETLTNSYILELNKKILSMKEEYIQLSVPNTTLENNIDELISLRDSIKQQGIKHIESSKELIKRFKDRMKKDPQTLELLVNLAKLTSQTSNTSSLDTTGEVELKHLKIFHSQNHHIVWDSEKDNKNGDIRFSATIPMNGELEEIKRTIKEYFSKSHVNDIPLEVKGREINFIVTKDNFLDFSQKLSEENIIKIKPHITFKLHKDYTPAFALAEKLSLLTSVTDEKLNPILDRNRLLTMWYHDRLSNGNILVYGIPNDNESLPKSLLLPQIKHFTDQIKGDKIKVELSRDQKKTFDLGHQKIQFILTPIQLDELTQKMTAEAIYAVKKESPLKGNLLRLNKDKEIFATMSTLTDSLSRLTSVTDEGLNFSPQPKHLTKWDFDKLPDGTFLVYGIPNDNATIHKKHLKDFINPFIKQLNPTVTVDIVKQENTSASHQQLQFIVTKEQGEALVKDMNHDNILKIKARTTQSVRLLQYTDFSDASSKSKKLGFFSRLINLPPKTPSKNTPHNRP